MRKIGSYKIVQKEDFWWVTYVRKWWGWKKIWASVSEDRAKAQIERHKNETKYYD